MKCVNVLLRNKAGYTANTSRGRVGRGGNACFHTFRLERDGPTNQRTDKASYRVACPRLKIDKRDSTTLTRKMLTGQVSPREPECRNILCFDEVGRSHRNAFASSFLAKKTNDYRRFMDELTNHCIRECLST